MHIPQYARVSTLCRHVHDPKWEKKKSQNFKTIKPPKIDVGQIEPLHIFPPQHTDMPEEMRVETMELCVTACEKFASNNEVRSHSHLGDVVKILIRSPLWFLTFLLSQQSAAKMIKESMDKKFGNSWHVVIGEGFGFEITHEVKNLLYMFFGGSLAVCVWKCS